MPQRKPAQQRPTLDQEMTRIGSSSNLRRGSGVPAPGTPAAPGGGPLHSLFPVSPAMPAPHTVHWDAAATDTPSAESRPPSLVSRRRLASASASDLSAFQSNQRVVDSMRASFPKQFSASVAQQAAAANAPAAPVTSVPLRPPTQQQQPAATATLTTTTASSNAAATVPEAVIRRKRSESVEKSVGSSTKSPMSSGTANASLSLSVPTTGAQQRPRHQRQGSASSTGSYPMTPKDYKRREDEDATAIEIDDSIEGEVEEASPGKDDQQQQQAPLPSSIRRTTRRTEGGFDELGAGVMATPRLDNRHVSIHSPPTDSILPQGAPNDGLGMDLDRSESMSEPNTPRPRREGHHQDSIIERATKITGIKLRYLFIIMGVLTLIVMALFFALMETQLNKALTENGLVTTRMAGVGLKEKAIDFMLLAATSGDVLLASEMEVRRQVAAAENQYNCTVVHNPQPPETGLVGPLPTDDGQTVDNNGIKYYFQNVSNDLAFTVKQLLLCSDTSFMGLQHYQVFNSTTGLKIPGQEYSCPDKLGSNFFVPDKTKSAIPQKLSDLTHYQRVVIEQTKEKVISYIPTTINETVHGNITHVDQLRGRIPWTVSASEWSKERMGRNFFSTSRTPDSGSQTAWDISHMTGAIMMKNSDYFTNGLSQKEYQVLFHTLTHRYKSYEQEQPTSVGILALDRFHTRCNFGRAHTWHIVLDTRTMQLSNLEEMPSPQIDRNKFRFNLPESATLCMVMCTRYSPNEEESTAFDGHCDLEDPNVPSFYMVVVTRLDWISDFVVEVMYVVYICAVVIIFCTCFFLHVSIAVPANYLHHKIASTVTNTPWQKTRWQQFKYTYSQWFWVGDMKALIKTFNIMADFYYLNRKFVPEHVLNRQAADIEDDEGSYFRDGSSLVMDDDPPSGHIRSPAADPHQDGMVSISAAPDGLFDDASALDSWIQSAAHGNGRGVAPTREVSTASAFDPMMSATNLQDLEHDGGDHLAVSASHMNRPIPTYVNPPQANAAQQSVSRFPIVAETTPFTSARYFKQHRGSVQQQHRNQGRSHNRPRHRPRKAHGAAAYYDDMSEVSEATILAIHLDLVEDAYKIDFNAAEIQHRQIYAAINAIIRRFKGEVFHRSGECFGVAWNAFETRPDHVMRGTNCALELANFFEELREQGLMMGLAVHQGPIVSGVLTDNNTMSNVVMGKAVDLALHIAQLGSKLPYFSVMLTEPVKQAVSIFYVCIIIDVIKIEKGDAPITVFEVRGLNESHATPLDMRKRTPGGTAGALVGSLGAANSSVASSLLDAGPTGGGSEIDDYVVEYNTAFAKFRAHNFTQAMHHLDKLRQKHGVDTVIERLMQLCAFYSQHSGLPKPYYRELPKWSLFEDNASALAIADGTGADTAGAGSSQLNTSSVPTTERGSQPGSSLLSSTTPHYSKSLKGSTHTPLYPSKNSREANFKQELRNAAALKQIRTPNSTTTSATESTRNPNSALGPVEGESAFDAAVSNMSVASNRGGSANADTRDGSSSVYSSPHFDSMPRQTSILNKSGSGVPILEPPPSSEELRIRRSNNASRGSTSIADDPSSCQLSPLVGIHVTQASQTASESAVGKGHQRGGSRGGGSFGAASESVTSVVLAENNSQLLNPEPSAVSGPSRSGSTAFDDGQGEKPAVGTEGEGSTNSQGGATASGGALAHSSSSDAALPLPSTAADGAGSRGPSPGQYSSTTNATTTSPMPNVNNSDEGTSTGGFAVGGNTPSNNPGSSSVGMGSGVSTTVAGGGPQPDLLNGHSIIKSCSFHSISGTLNMSINVNPAQFEASQLPAALTSNFGVKYIRSENILGRGSYGCVYLGMEEHTGKLIAIKFLPLPDEAEELEKIENEVSIMASIHDHFLVDFYGYSLFDGKIALFQECMVAGPLSNMLTSFSQLPAQTTVNFIRDVLKGLRKLHSNDIIHRDVKPQNVLLSTSGHCKISDFGASASIGVLARQQAQGMVLGTPMYLAPEAAKANPCAKSDIWSVGVMFLQLVTGKLPYDITPGLRANPALFVFQIGSGQLRPTIPDVSVIGAVTHQFVTACLAEEVDDRSSAEELLEMPFFTV